MGSAKRTDHSLSSQWPGREILLDSPLKLADESGERPQTDMQAASGSRAAHAASALKAGLAAVTIRRWNGDEGD